MSSRPAAASDEAVPSPSQPPGAPPILFHVVLYAAAASLACAALWVAGHILAGEPSPAYLWFPALCVATLVGLLRRVAWGRALSTGVSLLCTLVVVSVLIPDPDDVFAGGSALERLYGWLPPTWLGWLSIVVLSTATLVPALVLGWRRHWFRSARW